MIVLLGIDDTDNATSRGTGYHARRLGKALSDEGFADIQAVTRHQLLVDSRIDYTSRNSSVCLVLEASEHDITRLIDFARSELRSHCAPDSNGGISIAEPSAVDGAIQDFGRAAKHRVLSAETARALAQQKDVFLEGTNGSGAGVIGALAAAGLHRSGNDGRFIWLQKLRELDGTYTVGELTRLLGVEVTTISGEALPPAAEIKALEWMRPVLREGRAILLAERETQDGEIGWRLLDKSTVKALSD
ncbi:MAG: hypothetical protein ACE5M4_04605 [Anaerolineales bacterium]